MLRKGQPNAEEEVKQMLRKRANRRRERDHLDVGKEGTKF
jgi:hypothetical protein